MSLPVTAAREASRFTFISGNGMFAYIIRRLLEMIPVLLVVSLLVFGFIKLLPGDPARIYAGPDAPIEAVEAARQHLRAQRLVAAAVC